MRRTPRITPAALNVFVTALAMTAAASAWPAEGGDDAKQIQPGTMASVALRNNSGSELYFFLSEGSGWKTLVLKSGAEADLPRREAVVAIPTSDDAVAAASAPNSLPDDVLRTPFVHRTPYFYRQLKAGERWELCWSQKRDCWLVQRVGEGLCQ